jgi:class 3 adenylate cyclase
MSGRRTAAHPSDERRRPLPLGTVTLLFSDIVGSTRLLAETGSRYAELLARHRAIVREAIESHGGVEVDTEGDGTFAAFPRANDAVAAAEAIQRRHREGAVRVRIGLHTGEPELAGRLLESAELPTDEVAPVAFPTW